MSKMISMTASEIRRKFDLATAIERAKNAPEFDEYEINKELASVPGPIVARGPKEFAEYLAAMKSARKSGIPRARFEAEWREKRNAKNNGHDESVTIDLPRDYAKNLRDPKWSKAIGDYIVRGIDSGDLSLASA